MKSSLLSFFTVLLFACATVPPNDEVLSRVSFSPWIPFKYQVSYTGQLLPDEIKKADHFLSQGRYENALMIYQRHLYEFPRFRRDISHRIAVSMILLRQPLRALEFMNSIRERQHFQNPEGIVIRIKAQLDSRRIRQAVAESDKFLRLNPKSALREKLRIILVEKLRTDSNDELKAEIRKFPDLVEFLFPDRAEQKRWDQGRSDQRTDSVVSNFEAESVCALLPLSGQLSNLGSKIAQGLSLRFENNHSTLQLVIQDVGSSATDFQQNFNNLVSRQRCSVFLGPFLSDQVTEFSQMNFQRVFSIILARRAQPGLTNSVHLGLTNRSQIITILSLLNSQGFKNVAIVLGPSQFSQDFTNEFVSLSSNFGVRPIPVVLEGFDDRSIENFERKLISVSVDTVVLPLSPSEVADLMLGLSDKVKTSHQFIGTALLDDEVLLSQSKNLFKGIVFPSFFVKTRENQAIIQFLDNMAAKQLGGMVDAFSALGYEVADLIIAAYQDYGVISQDTIAKATQNRVGLLGRYTLDYFPSLERFLFLRKVE